MSKTNWQKEAEKWQAASEENGRKVDFLAQHLVMLIGRYHGLRVAHGDMAPEALMLSVNNDAGQIRAMMDAACIAQPDKVS